MGTPGIKPIKQATPAYLIIRGRPQQLYVTIENSTKDGGLAGASNDAGASTKLQPGLLLAPYTSGTNDGKYGNFQHGASNGTGNEEDIVILLDNVDDASTSDQMFSVAYGGAAIFDRKQLRHYLAANESAMEWEKMTVPSVV